MLVQPPPQPASSTYACWPASPSRASEVPSRANVAVFVPAPAPSTLALAGLADVPRTTWPVLDEAETFDDWVVPTVAKLKPPSVSVREPAPLLSPLTFGG